VKSQRELDELVINTIRFLSVDQVERAKSGHPGMPLGASHIIYLIFDRFLRFNPRNPEWINRDRFVLSAGHASAMLYATLYMFGYEISLEDLKRFRQLNSITPGHPENWLTPGVEATTGPLGQGFGNAVGMALAEKFLSAHFNRKDYPVIDHYTYVLCSDGDLMEGVSYEAAALAGHWKLNKLIVVWDNNRVSIDGSTSLAWSEDVLSRFSALGWDVYHIEDGYDLDKLEDALRRARESDKPSFISVRTHLGYGSPLQDDPKAHGAPLGRENVEETKKRWGWPLQEFYVPEEALAYTRRHVELGRKRESEWNSLFSRYQERYPELAQELLRAFERDWSMEWACQDASGRIGGSVRIKQHIPDELSGLLRGKPKGEKRPLRCKGTRYGSYHERCGLPRRSASLRWNLPRLLRLHETPYQSGSHGRTSGDLRPHPRFHRSGRRRTHPPAC